MKKLIIGCIIFLSIISIGVGVFMFYLIRNDNSFSGILSNSSLELTNTRTFSIEDIEKIKVSYVAESIHIYESDTDELILKEYLSSDDEKYFARITSSGHTLEIKHGNRGIFNFLFGRIELYLPSVYQNELDMASSSGSIKSEMDLSLSRLSASTVSGSLKLGEITADTIKLSTTSGSIQAENTTGQIKASSVSGSIKIADGAFGGSCATTSGSVKLDSSALTSDLKVSSVSGGVKLSIRKDQPFQFTASSVSGTVKTTFDDKINRQKSNKASGTVGSAGGFSVNIKTTSGSIKVMN